MRNLSILAVAVLCSSCAIRAHDIQIASPQKNQAVVFDIDGTLTPKVSAYSAVREDAARAAHLYADKGYLVVYLTARRRLFQFGIPRWLDRKGFPGGNLQVKNKSDSDNHAVYKKRVLREFQEKGWQLFAAYGDKSTDFEAYSAAGIDQGNVYALKAVGEDACQPGPWAECLDSWTEHLDSIAEIVEP